MKIPVITLLTDFGLKDSFAGAMKGVILSINPGANIVDITHEVSPGDIFQGAFSLLNAYKYFPDGTVHVAVVDPGVGGSRKGIIIRAGGHLFVSPDNGIASLAAMDRCAEPEIYEITSFKYCLRDISNTFHGRDIFAPVGAHLSMGVSPAKIGRRAGDFIRLKIPAPVIDGNRARASIIYIDRFGNLIININNSMVDRIRRIDMGERVIERISSFYEEGIPGEPIAVAGSAGFLEISVNGASAAEVLGKKRGDEIILEVN